MSSGSPIRTIQLGDGTKITYNSLAGPPPQIRQEKDGSYSIFGANSTTQITGAKQGSHINLVNSQGATFNGSGKGNDSVNLFDCKGVKVNGNDGNDRVQVFGGKDNKVNGGNGNDFIRNMSNNTKVDGGKGNDTIFSRGGNNQIYGGDGRDRINSYGYHNKVDGGWGNDMINSFGFGNQNIGGPGFDFVNGQREFGQGPAGFGSSPTFGFAPHHGPHGSHHRPHPPRGFFG